mgnify:CR=1 FL=1
MHTLILAAGKIDYTRLPFGMHQSNATIPVNGKPVISWILDDLIKKNIKEVSIVIREENKRLKQLLDKHYSNRIGLNIIPISNPKSLLSSIFAGIENIDVGAVQLILGDTLIYDSYSNMSDTIYVSPVSNSSNWCTAQVNDSGELVALIDKKNLEGDDHIALCGYYCLSDVSLLKQIVLESLKNEDKELSAVLLRYHKTKKVSLKHVENWFDFGHLESFIQSRKSLLRPRHFNSLVINPILNTLTKYSEKNDKLLDELNWYKLLPEDIQALTPRIFNQKDSGSGITITQEFYGYPTLSELFVYGDLSVSVWESIIDYLMQIHQLLKSRTKIDEVESCRTMYDLKTKERIDSLLQQNSFWQDLFKHDEIIINNSSYENVSSLIEKLGVKIEKICSKKELSIIHGDFCMSNILYDLNNQIVRLIDPRGSFGQKGIYGDSRYDIAKLRHSIVGNYDYIVGDLFTVQHSENEFQYGMFEDDKDAVLKKYFDKVIQQQGYSIEEIKLIEGLLFISMIPYHVDHFDRQKMMFIRGIEILNELV